MNLSIFKIGLAVFTIFLSINLGTAQKSDAQIAALNKVDPANKNEIGVISAELDQDRKCTIYTGEHFIISSEPTTVDGRPCLQVKRPGATQWMTLENDIKYFEYEKGYEYVISYQLVAYDDESLPKEYILTGVFSKEKKESDMRKPHQLGVTENTTWTIEMMNGKQMSGSVTFYEEGRGSAYAGCNHISFEFKHNKKKKTLNITDVIMTEMACFSRDEDGPNVMELEGILSGILYGEIEYTATAKKMIIEKEGKEVLVLVR
ncbi:MAG: META domain-containing protein [Saprospiraceae bacterium]|nr:META domain-containing protein [Saprospiraceae bacterium]